MSRVRLPILARCNRMYNAIIDDMNGVSPSSNKRPRSERRKKTREELWRDIREYMYPDWIHMTEEEQETVENNFEINYFIALGANKSIPSTVTSNSQGNNGVISGPLVFTGTPALNFQALYTAPVMYNPRRMYSITPMYRTPALLDTNADARTSFNSTHFVGYPSAMTLSRTYEYASASYREFMTTGGYNTESEPSGSGTLARTSSYGWPAITQAANENNAVKPNGHNYDYPSTSARSRGFNEIGYGGYNSSGSVAATSASSINNYNAYMSDLSYGTNTNPMNTLNREDISGPLDLRPSRKRALDYCQLDPLPPFSTLQRDVRTPQPSTSYYSQYAMPSMSRSPLMITMNGDANNNVGDEIDPFQFAIEQSLKY